MSQRADVPSAPHPRDLKIAPQERLRRRRAERENHRRRDNRDLLVEERAAVLHLLRLGCAIAQTVGSGQRRSALDRITNIHFLTRKTDCAEHAVEQLTGAPDERPAELVFGFARTFADDHQPRARIAFAVHVVTALVSNRATPASVGGNAMPPTAGAHVRCVPNRSWRARLRGHRDRLAESNDFARAVVSLGDEELQADHGVGAQRVGTAA